MPLVGWIPKSRNPKVPSARIRCLDPLAVLRRQGRPVEPFRGARASSYRVAVFQKQYDDEHRELARSLKQRGCRIVLDLCDHPFYNPTRNPRYEADARRLRAMLEVADVVTVPSEELARHLPVPAVVVRDGIAPPPGWSRFYGPLLPRRGECVEIAWYGMAGSGRAPSGMRDLLQIAPVLERLSGEFPLRLTVISNSREAWEKEIRPLGLPTRYLEWGSHGRFCGLLPRHDLCLIPVNRNPYTLCKSNNRLALSLYLGVPVVADAIPSYREFEPFCVLDDWEGGLRRYLGSAEARQADAAAGQQYVRERYGVERAAADWWSLFERLLAGEESGTRAVQAAGVSA